jgi:hypothetical protein
VSWIFHTPSLLMLCRQRLDITIKCSEIKQDIQWQRGSFVIFFCCNNLYHVIYVVFIFFMCSQRFKKPFLPVTARGGVV